MEVPALLRATFRNELGSGDVEPPASLGTFRIYTMRCSVRFIHIHHCSYFYFHDNHIVVPPREYSRRYWRLHTNIRPLNCRNLDGHPETPGELHSFSLSSITSNISPPSFSLAWSPQPSLSPPLPPHPLPTCRFMLLAQLIPW